jgi:hypothetical protein
MKRFLTVCAALSLSFASVARAQDIPAEYQQVLTSLGKQGDYKANVLKLNIPRSDVSVTVANVKTPTPFGFGGWVAMTKGTGGMDVMMGDLVLLQDEVNPVSPRCSTTAWRSPRFTITSCGMSRGCSTCTCTGTGRQPILRAA